MSNNHTKGLPRAVVRDNSNGPTEYNNAQPIRTHHVYA